MTCGLDSVKCFPSTRIILRYQPWELGLDININRFGWVKQQVNSGRHPFGISGVRQVGVPWVQAHVGQDEDRAVDSAEGFKSTFPRWRRMQRLGPPRTA